MALNLPEFASEKEEADWWYDHRDEVSDDFAAAVAEGKVRSVRSMLLEDHNLILPDAFVSLPMSNADLDHFHIYCGFPNRSLNQA